MKTKFKKFPINKELDEMLKKEVKASALTGNSICIIALTEYLKKKEKERK